LLVGVVTVTLVIALSLIRWFAPQLLGIPVDLQAVRVSKEVPPFFENAFRGEDIISRKFLLNDPYTGVRARPLLLDLSGFGPHDLLGFRNRSIPNVADIIAIGDSQTYGNNTVLEENWPSQLEKMLGDRKPVVYGMATGGWGAVQYLDMFSHAAHFLPRVVVVAFYTGNDAAESVKMAYSTDRWASLRPDPDLDLSDKPPNPGFPPPPAEQWPVRFRSGLTTVFTPRLRLTSNDTGYATVRAGYRIMEEAARLMSKGARRSNIHLVLTVIPTKELAYAERVRREEISANPDYAKLIGLERANIERLAQTFRSLPNVIYVDMLEAMQKAASTDLQLYPPDGTDGHPMEAGNRVIAAALAPAVMDHLVQSPSGLVGIATGKGELFPLLVTKQGLWRFATREIAEKNGWVLDRIRIVALRDIAALPQRGTIDVVDPEKFGPRTVRPETRRPDKSTNQRLDGSRRLSPQREVSIPDRDTGQEE
jgi:lysophospholipase L1-like esterase